MERERERGGRDSGRERKRGREEEGGERKGERDWLRESYVMYN